MSTRGAAESEDAASGADDEEEVPKCKSPESRGSGYFEVRSSPDAVVAAAARRIGSPQSPDIAKQDPQNVRADRTARNRSAQSTKIYDCKSTAKSFRFPIFTYVACTMFANGDRCAPLGLCGSYGTLSI